MYLVSLLCSMSVCLWFSCIRLVEIARVFNSILLHSLLSWLFEILVLRLINNHSHNFSRVNFSGRLTILQVLTVNFNQKYFNKNFNNVPQMRILKFRLKISPYFSYLLLSTVVCCIHVYHANQLTLLNSIFYG